MYCSVNLLLARVWSFCEYQREKLLQTSPLSVSPVTNLPLYWRYKPLDITCLESQTSIPSWFGYLNLKVIYPGKQWISQAEPQNQFECLWRWEKVPSLKANRVPSIQPLCDGRLHTSRRSHHWVWRYSVFPVLSLQPLEVLYDVSRGWQNLTGIHKLASTFIRFIEVLLCVITSLLCSSSVLYVITVILFPLYNHFYPLLFASSLFIICPLYYRK
jgi:hypothetical protein